MILQLNDIEEEVVILKAINELIDSMVNYEILNLYGSDPNSSILFNTMTHREFFNIILVDFLSCTDKKGPVKQNSYLGALSNICKSPYFNFDNSIRLLYDSTKRFIEWLKQEVRVDIWIPSIDTNTNISISRLRFIKMCGNISKHNILRSIGVAEDLENVLGEDGVLIDLNDAMLALDDFYERFHIDIFNYHGSAIAEFLNNIRWGIYDYLQPEFNRSIVREEGDFPRYRYTFPKTILHKFAKTCYWGLMDEVSNKPLMRRFQVTESLKMEY